MNDNKHDRICERIKSLRLSANLTQTELAERCGMLQEAIARYEAGRVPSVDALRRIAKGLGVKVAELLG